MNFRQKLQEFIEKIKKIFKGKFSRVKISKKVDSLDDIDTQTLIGKEDEGDVVESDEIEIEVLPEEEALEVDEHRSKSEEPQIEKPVKFEQPKIIIPPSLRKQVTREKKTEVDTSEGNQITPKKIKPNVKNEVKLKEPYFEKNFQLLLDLKDGRIKLQLPVISFPSLAAYEEACPITCDIKILDAKGIIISSNPYTLTEEHCIINDREENSHIIEDIPLFKSITCTIKCIIPKLENEIKFKNLMESIFIFEEVKEKTIFVQNLDQTYDKVKYLWFLNKNNIIIKPKPKVYSEIVQYSGYKLEYICLNEQTNYIQIIDPKQSKDPVLEFYRLPEINLYADESKKIIDVFYDKEPIFSGDFKIHLIGAEVIKKTPKVVFIQNYKTSKSVKGELNDPPFEWNDDKAFKVSPADLYKPIGHYQIVVQFYKDKDHKIRLFENNTFKKNFRYCPVIIKDQNRIIIPGLKYYDKFPLQIETIGVQDLELYIDNNKVKRELKAEKYVFNHIIPLGKDAVKLTFIDCVNINNTVFVHIFIPRIKWHLIEVKNYSNYIGDKIGLDFEEFIAREEELTLEIRIGSVKCLPDLMIRINNEDYPIKYNLRQSTYSYNLLEHSKKIYKLFDRHNNLDIKLCSDKFEITVLEISKEETIQKELDESITNPPFVEYDFSNNVINLVIPEQTIKKSKINLDDIEYKIKLDGVLKDGVAYIEHYKEKYIKICRKEIKIKDPLRYYYIKYPQVDKPYKYKHSCPHFYLFKGKSKREEKYYSKMEYIYLENESLILIPKKHFFILHSDEYELTEISEYKIKSDTIWGIGKLKWVDLRSKNAVKLTNVNTGKIISFPCELDLFLTGNRLEIDSKGTFNPLFTGDTIELNSLIENPDGWEIRINTRGLKRESRMLMDNWTGQYPFVIKCTDHLGCESGIFYLRIHNKGSSYPIKSLKFRYIKQVEVKRDQSLIIPGEAGHDQNAFFELILGESLFNWDIKLPSGVDRILNSTKTGYKIIVPQSKNAFKIILKKKRQNKSETFIHITVPRLMWRINIFKNWIDKAIEIDRGKIIKSNERIYLEVNTYDIINLYNINAILMTTEDSFIIQEILLEQKSDNLSNYQCLLNDLIEDLEENSEELCLKIHIEGFQQQSTCLIFTKYEKAEIDEELEETKVEDHQIHVEEEKKAVKPKIPKKTILSHIKIEKINDKILNQYSYKECIQIGKDLIQRKRRCEIHALGILIPKAVLISESLRTQSEIKLHYDSIKVKTKTRESSNKLITQLKLTLIHGNNNYNVSIPKNVDIFVDSNEHGKIISRIKENLNRSGFCEIKANGIYIKDSITISEKIRSRSPTEYCFEKIIPYLEKRESIYIKISKIKKQKKESKTLFKYKLGRSEFDIFDFDY